MATLNDTIVAYLTVNKIPFSSNDYMTGQPEGQPDQILKWDTEKLGAQPTQEQLDSSYPIYEGQQIAAKNKADAMALLAATDWTQNPDVGNASVTPHLVNQADFSAYRAAVRAVAVNPPTTPANFPTLPAEQWSK